MGCFNGSLYLFSFTRSMGKKWTLEVLLILIEFRNFGIKRYPFFYRSFCKAFFYLFNYPFSNWNPKFLYFEILLEECILWIIEELFQSNKYFNYFHVRITKYESKRNTNGREFIPIKWFINFLFWRPNSYRGTFFTFFPSLLFKEKRKNFVIPLLDTHFLWKTT